MDSQKYKRIKEICFSNNQLEKRSQFAFGSKSRDARTSTMEAQTASKSMHEKSQILSPGRSIDNSIQRMKERSRSRTQKIQDKINSSKSPASLIQKQPSQLLKQAGAYRLMRKTQNVDPGDKENLKYECVSPSYTQHYDADQTLLTSVDQESPRHRSRFQNLRKKSEDRQVAKSHSKQPQSAAQKLFLMQRSNSRSRSRSGTGATPTGGRGCAQKMMQGQHGADQSNLKKLENEVSATIQTKQNALKQNLEVLKQRLAHKKQLQENLLREQLQSQSMIQGVGRGDELSPSDENLYRRNPHSFVQGDQGFDASESLIQRVASNSPPSFHSLNQRQGALCQSFGRTPKGVTVQTRDNEDSVLYRDHVTTVKQEPNSSMLNLQVPAASFPRNTQDLASKLRSTKLFMSQILSMVWNSQEDSRKVKQADSNAQILSQAAFKELKLKLEGAFERLDTISDEFDQSEQLLNILTNFLNDLQQKIYRSFGGCDASQGAGPEMQGCLLQNVLLNLLDQIAKIDFHDAIPHIARALYDLRISLAVQKLQTLASGQRSSSQVNNFFNALKRDQNRAQRQSTQLKKVLQKYTRRTGQVSVRAKFHYWKLLFQKRFRDQLQVIVNALNTFGQSVVSQAPSSNYQVFKGLQQFDELVRALLLEVLAENLHGIRVFLDVLYVNKSGTQACSFISEERTGGVCKQTYDIQEGPGSLLRLALGDSFTPGKCHGSAKFTKIQQNKHFNAQVDLPMVSDQEKLKLLSEDIYQLTHPIQTQSLKNIKLALRLTTIQKDMTATVAQLQFVKFTLEEISQPILSALKQFKDLSKKFGEFHSRLAASAEASLTSKKSLDQLHFLNRASLELACHHSTTQIFELINVTVLSIIQSPVYENCSLILIKDGKVLKLFDQTKAIRSDQANPGTQIGYVEEPNIALSEKMRELGQLCSEGTCPPWIQILFEQADNLKATGKTAKDIIIIPITQNTKGSSDLSKIELDAINNTLADDASNENLTSFAWDSTQSAQGGSFNKTALRVSQHRQGQDIIFVKLERQLSKIQDQIPFDRHQDAQNILKTLTKFIHICLTKLFMVAQSIENKLDQDKSISEKEDSFLELTRQNGQLKKLLKAQKAMQKFTMDANQAVMGFDEFEKKIKSVIQDYVPKAKEVKLFLSKDERGETLYTYCKSGEQLSRRPEQISSFASLIKAQNHHTGQGCEDLANKFGQGIYNDQWHGNLENLDHHHQDIKGTENGFELFKQKKPMRPAGIEDLRMSGHSRNQGPRNYRNNFDKGSGAVAHGKQAFPAGQGHPLLGPQRADDLYRSQGYRIENSQPVLGSNRSDEQEQFSPKDRVSTTNKKYLVRSCSQKNGLASTTKNYQQVFIDQKGQAFGDLGHDQQLFPMSQDFIEDLVAGASRENPVGKSLRKYKSMLGDFDMIAHKQRQVVAESVGSASRQLWLPQQAMFNQMNSVEVGTIGQGLYNDYGNEEHTATDPVLENLTPQLNTRKECTTVLQTAGFNERRKGATQQVPDQIWERNQGRPAAHRDQSESKFSDETPDAATNDRHEELKVQSSYADLVKDMIEDEFELTVDHMKTNLRKIHLTLGELTAKQGVRSLLDRAIRELRTGKGEIGSSLFVKKNFSKDQNFCPQIDGLISQSSDHNQNPLKRAKAIENCIYAPLVYRNQILYGIVQIANTDPREIFTEEDVNFIKLVCTNIATCLHTQKQQFIEKMASQKRVNSTILSAMSHTVDSSQAILVLSNKLFQEKQNPFKALQLFLYQTEQYLTQWFSCEAAQILLIDQTEGQFLTFENCGSKSQQLVQRGQTTTRSVANHVLAQEQSYSYPPIRYYNSVNSALMSRRTWGQSILNQSVSYQNAQCNSQQHMGCHLAFLFNPEIDVPPEYFTSKLQANAQTGEYLRPNTFLAQAVTSPLDQSFLAVLQLVQKRENQKFTDQDAVLAQQVADQLSQILSDVHSSNFLSSVSYMHVQGVYKLNDALQSKYRCHLKQFFFELVAIRHGKNVVLKNKIIRKQLTQGLQLDRKFVEKTQKLMALAEKFSKKTKKATMARLSHKLDQIRIARKVNAEKSLRILEKYHKILSIRLKDVTFQSWVRRLKAQRALLGSDASQTACSIKNSRVTFNDKDFLVESGREREGTFDLRSIVSNHYLKAKQLYLLKGIFNKHNLKVQFDIFVLKCFKNYARGLRILRQSKQSGQLRNLVLHKYLTSKMLARKAPAFNQLYRSFKWLKQRSQKLCRLLCHLHKQLASSGLNRWKRLFSDRYRADAAKNFELLRKSKEQNVFEHLLSLILKQTSLIFEPRYQSSASMYRSAEECFHSPAFKNMMYEILQYILGTYGDFPFRPDQLEIQEVVFNFALPPGQSETLVNPATFAQLSFCRSHSREQACDWDEVFTPEIPPIVQQRCPNQDSTYRSITDVMMGKLSDFKNKNDQVLIERIYQQKTKILQEEQQVKNKFDLEFRYKSLAEDTLIKAVESTKKAFCLEKLKYDKSIFQNLQNRRINLDHPEESADGNSKILLAVPINDESSNYAGSLEIYGTQKDKKKAGEEIPFLLQVFQKYANTIGQGMKHFMLSLLNRLSLHQSLITSELNFELSAFLPAQVRAGTGGGDLRLQQQSPIKFSKAIFELDLMIKKAFKADAARVIFLPYECPASQGILMEGPLNNRKAFKINFTNTLLEQMIRNKNCSSMTVPSGLVCAQVCQSLEGPDPQYSTKGECFQALKYLRIEKNSHQFFGVIEIAWHYLEQAQLVHENQIYLNKKEEKVVSIAKEVINQTYMKLKLLTGSIKQKTTYETLRAKRKSFFMLWKRVTFFQPLVQSLIDQDEQSYAPTQFKNTGLEQSQDTMVPQYCPVLPCQTLTQDLSLSVLRRSAHLQNADTSGYLSAFSQQKANIAPYKSAQREKQIQVQQTILKQHLENFQRSLKIIKLMSKKEINKLCIKSYFKRWQLFMRNGKLAEQAFEQVVKIHENVQSNQSSAQTSLSGNSQYFQSIDHLLGTIKDFKQSY